MSKEIKKIERPEVTVSSLTANMIEVVVETADGTVRFVCEHSEILVQANGVKIRVKP